MKCKQLKDKSTANLPAGTKMLITPKGYMNSSIFVKYLQHFAQFRVNWGPTLLIFDGASSLLDASIVTEAGSAYQVIACTSFNL